MSTKKKPECSVKLSVIRHLHPRSSQHCCHVPPSDLGVSVSSSSWPAWSAASSLPRSFFSCGAALRGPGGAPAPPAAPRPSRGSAQPPAASTPSPLLSDKKKEFSYELCCQIFCIRRVNGTFRQCFGSGFFYIPDSDPAF
jgi:hypothetical protein